MRQTTSTPQRAAEGLLTPAAAIAVSVTTEAPRRSASRPRFTAPCENASVLTKSKSAVVWTTRFTTGRSSAAPRHSPISRAMISMLARSISSGLMPSLPFLQSFMPAGPPGGAAPQGDHPSGTAARSRLNSTSGSIVPTFQNSIDRARSGGKSPK